MPSESLTSLRVRPVSGLFTVTVTPGTAAFCASTIRPWTLPVVCCANAGIPTNVSIHTITPMIGFFISTPLDDANCVTGDKASGAPRRRDEVTLQPDEPSRDRDV